MEKTKYIKPEIDVVAHLAQPFLAGISGNVIDSEKPNTPGLDDGGGTSDPGEFARQHNNWMWDNLEE
jgi:hypothetical protein